MKPTHDFTEGPTPIEQLWGAEMSVAPSEDCLEADLLIELAETGRSSPRWKTGMDHIVRCAACGKRYQETLLLTQMSPRRAGSFVSTLAGSLSDFRERLFRRPSLVPFVLGSVATAVLFWFVWGLPSRRTLQNLQTANSEMAALRRELADRTQSVAAISARLADAEARMRTRDAEFAAYRRTHPSPPPGTISPAPRPLTPKSLDPSPSPPLRIALAQPTPAPAGPAPISLESLNIPNLRRLASSPADEGGRGAGEPPLEPSVSSRIELLTPVASRVRCEGVILRWKSARKDAMYRVQVTDMSRSVTLFSTDTSKQEYALPARLPAGKLIRWNVSLLIDGKETASSENAYLETLTAAEAERIRTELSRAGADPRRQAAILVGSGLLADASGALGTYLSKSPRDTDMRRLRDRIRATLHALRESGSPATQ